jgi:hypothetical protein
MPICIQCDTGTVHVRFGFACLFNEVLHGEKLHVALSCVLRDAKSLGAVQLLRSGWESFHLPSDVSAEFSFELFYSEDEPAFFKTLACR